MLLIREQREQRLQIDLHGRDHSHVHCISTTPEVLQIMTSRKMSTICVWTREQPPHKQQCSGFDTEGSQTPDRGPEQTALTHAVALAIPPITTPITTFNSDKRAAMLYVRSACTEMLSLP